MTTRTQSFVLLLFGGALLRLASGDALLRYVRPVARPWVFLAGLGMVLLALWSLVASARAAARARAAASSSPAPAHESEADGVDAHGHRGATRTAWLVVAPVVAILVIAPPALGSFSATRAPSTVTKPSDVHFPALTGPDPVQLSMIDLAARAVWDAGRTLQGHTLSITGFVLHGGSGGFVMARLVITCCAADARPIDIGIQSAAPAPAAGTWVTITGRYVGESPADATLPLLQAEKITPIKAPANPYDG